MSRESKYRNKINRPQRTRFYKERILIVCEGKKTEPNYFKSFKTKIDVIEIDIHGAGKNTDNLIKETIKLITKADSLNKPYVQAWCVFDKDSFTAKQFNRAIELAENNHIKVAYSNEAFELWYLLHFHYYNTGISRKDYIKKLSKLLKKKYKKNDPKIHNELSDKQNKAIANAKKLMKNYKPCPAADNPSTTVYKLVEELNKYI